MTKILKKPVAKNKGSRPKPRSVPPRLELELFVSGITPKSVRAIEVLKDMCEEHFSGCYSLKIIDIYREPEKAKQNQVFAVPTLIRRYPGPRRMFIGDFSNVDPVLREFGIMKVSKNGA